MPSLQNLNITEGRDFTQNDEEHASHVCIIGTDIRDNLLAGVDPIGQELRVDGSPYTVIGVSEKQGSTFGASQDNWVGIPLTAYQKSYGTARPDRSSKAPRTRFASSCGRSATMPPVLKIPSSWTQTTPS
jgi:putative ABC transport system permease protein